MPCVSMEELGRWLFPFNVPVENRFMAVMYGGYFDEGGDDVSFGVAGFIAPYDTWVHLDWKWKDLLTKWRLNYFKTSECVNGLEQFAQYRDNPKDQKSKLKENEFQKLREIYDDFLDAILKHYDYIQGYGAVTPCADFQKIISESEKARRLFMEHPYYLCLQSGLHASTERMYLENLKRDSENRLYIKPIFDSHKEFSDKAKIAYDKFREKNKRAGTVLLPLDYEDDIDTPALQVADVLAYEARKHATNLKNNPERLIRPSFQRLLRIIDRIKRLDYKTLQLILDNQRPDLIDFSHDANAKSEAAQ